MEIMELYGMIIHKAKKALRKIINFKQCLLYFK